MYIYNINILLLFRKVVWAYAIAQSIRLLIISKASGLTPNLLIRKTYAKCLFVTSFWKLLFSSHWARKLPGYFVRLRVGGGYAKLDQLLESTDIL